MAAENVDGAGNSKMQSAATSSWPSGFGRLEDSPAATTGFEHPPRRKRVTSIAHENIDFHAVDGNFSGLRVFYRKG
jgi:hypothetical protein